MNQQIQVPVIGEATFQPGTATTRQNVFMESRLWIMRNVTRETRMLKMTPEQDKEEASCLKWHQSDSWNMCHLNPIAKEWKGY